MCRSVCINACLRVRTLDACVSGAKYPGIRVRHLPSAAAPSNFHFWEYVSSTTYFPGGVGPGPAADWCLCVHTFRVGKCVTVCALSACECMERTLGRETLKPPLPHLPLRIGWLRGSFGHQGLPIRVMSSRRTVPFLLDPRAQGGK